MTCELPECDRPASRTGSVCYGHTQRLKRTGSYGGPIPKRTLTSKVAFDSLYEEGAEDECWLWQGTVDESTGYGRYGQKRAHVLALSKKEPRPSEGKRSALHDVKCISRLCVNSAHLRWGTQRENTADIAVVGNRKGEKSAMAKLTDEQVREIKVMAEDSLHKTCVALGEKYEVNQATIYDILKGRTWSHI